MARDHHADGQHDQEKSRSDTTWDIIRSGGSSSHYNPPSDSSESREQYKSGWDNAKEEQVTLWRVDASASCNTTGSLRKAMTPLIISNTQPSCLS